MFRTYCVPGVRLGADDMVLNKMDKDLCPHGDEILVGKTKDKQNK